MSSINYAPHGGIHQVAVVHCPNIFGQRLAHLSQDGPTSWVLRDFITGKFLRRSRTNQSGCSLLLAQIEAEVAYSETPLFHNVKNEADWTTHLTLRSMAFFGAPPTTALPSGQIGNWKPL